MAVRWLMRCRLDAEGAHVVFGDLQVLAPTVVIDRHGRTNGELVRAIAAIMTPAPKPARR